MNLASKFAGTLIRRTALVLTWLAISAAYLWAGQGRTVTGMVLKIDRAHSAVTISCDSIPGYMDAMVMSFAVHEGHALEALAPGERVLFTVTEEKGIPFAESIQLQPFQSLEQDPAQARRLKLVENMLHPATAASRPLAIGERAPDFHLIDQKKREISLSQFTGKVVAITFVYSRCPFPNYCFRLSNNFGQLQKRFGQRLGRDLVLLSIVIDPVHDQPEQLARYAEIWRANPDGWHFLTGPVPEIKRVCDKFDMSFYPDEALFVHSFHTAILDRQGRLAANIEGNDFSPEQLGDLVEATLVLEPNDGPAR